MGLGLSERSARYRLQGRFGVALVDALAHLHLHEVARGNQVFGLLARLPGSLALAKLRCAGWLSLALTWGALTEYLQLLLERTQALLARA